MSPTLNPALVLLATRRDEIALALQRADEERIACAERHRMYVIECERLSAELEAFDAAVGGLQAAEQSAAALFASRLADELEPFALAFPHEATGTGTTLAPRGEPIVMFCAAFSQPDPGDGSLSLCTLEAGHAGDHIAMSGDRILAQWGKGEEYAVPTPCCPSCGSIVPSHYLGSCAAPDEPVDPWHTAAAVPASERGGEA